MAALAFSVLSLFAERVDAAFSGVFSECPSELTVSAGEEISFDVLFNNNGTERWEGYRVRVERSWSEVILNIGEIDYVDPGSNINWTVAMELWATPTAPGAYTMTVHGEYFTDYPDDVEELSSSPKTIDLTVSPSLISYVWTGSPSEASPYSTWNTAAHTIQDAVDACGSGGSVIVTNGVYNSGGRAVYGAMTNRVAIDRAITVRSVNGPEVTIIEGTGPLGDSAVRCVYIGTNATLAGFTLTNGHTRATGNLKEKCGGGAWCEESATISDCVVSGNSCNNLGGGIYRGEAKNCVISGNSSWEGGGFYLSNLSDCEISFNSTTGSGGGGRGELSALDNCVISNNTASYSAGGVYYCVLNNCTIVDNHSDGDYGGVGLSYLTNCVIKGNSADGVGGGGGWYQFSNCLIVSNSAGFGGGIAAGSLNNCTVVGNSASESTGGIGYGLGTSSANNCLIWGNTAPVFDNWFSTNDSWRTWTINFSCTTPLPPGTNNLDFDPLFEGAGDYHLSIGSPCVDAGNNGAVMGVTDLDGLPRMVHEAVDMGAYEYPWPDTDEDGMPDRFEWQSIGNITNLVTSSDQDDDGLDNLDEYYAGTSASNPASCFRFETIATQNTNDMAISWQSVTGKRYGFYRTTNLPFGSQPFLTNILATPPMNTVTDRTATGRGPWFYRVTLE